MLAYIPDLTHDEASAGLWRGWEDTKGINRAGFSLDYFERDLNGRGW